MEVIDHDVDGFLIPVGDTTAMARAGISLLSDPTRLKQFKQAAAELAIKKFSADKIITQYENYYEEVLNG
jgi:L-malate glycosyltransferase